ncbi:MAG: hypothetical protein AAGI34_07715 [Pseudomonadota bacterium]
MLGQGSRRALAPPRWRRQHWQAPVVLGVGSALALTAIAFAASRVLAIAPLWQIGLAMALYLAAHALRALRLAVLASVMLGISVRSAVLMHFVTAPAVLLVPFKLGELARLQQLWLTGKHFSGALVVLIIERALDAVMLMVLILWLLRAGDAAAASTLLLLIQGALLAGLVLFLVGPRLIAGLQRYIVVNHMHPASLRVLPHIDVIRRNVAAGGGLLRVHGAVLVLSTVLIWTLELLAIRQFAEYAADPALQSADALLLGRITEEWRLLFGQVLDPALIASSAVNILVLALIWLPAALVYLPRMRAEPRRRAATEHRALHSDVRA